jgi:hypothetical protein
MESVIIAAPFAYDAQLKLRLEPVGPLAMGAGGVIVVDDGTSRVYVARNDAVYDEFETGATRARYARDPEPGLLFDRLQRHRALSKGARSHRR